MNFKIRTLMAALGLVILAGIQVCSAASRSEISGIAQSDTAPGLASYFTPATKKVKAPDAEGFLQRWLLLEPINKPNRGNTVFTDSYVRTAFNTEYFPNQFTVFPRNGDKVKVGDQELAWHALDSNIFNVKLFRFAFGLNKQTYGVIF